MPRIKFHVSAQDSKDSKDRFIDINSVPDPNIKLKVLKGKQVQCIGEWHDRNFTTQVSQWFIFGDDGKVERGLFHERAHFSAAFGEKSSIEYWLTDIEFENPTQALSEIVKRGCDPKCFYAQHHFYSETGYFLIVQGDFDQAMKFLGYQYIPETPEKNNP